jgi:hypothetical protein
MDKITVKYGTLKKVVKAIDKINPTDDTEISFEYLVGSCFPNILKNIKQALHTQYTNGYVEGLREGKLKNEKNSKRLS